MARRGRFGVLYHRGAAQSGVRSPSRKVTITARVRRNRGAGRACQYLAFAAVHGPAGSRTGSGHVGRHEVCGSTPTLAIKRALRVLAAQQWTR